MRILLRSDLDLFEGDGVDLIFALLKYGVIDLHLEPCKVAVPLPADVAVLFTKDRPASFDLILHLVDARLLKAAEKRTDGAITVAWTWCAGALPVDIEARLAAYDLIISYDLETSDRLAGFTGEVPQATLFGGYTARDWPVLIRDWFDTGFCFGLIGAHPGVQRAFRELAHDYPEDFEGTQLNVRSDEVLFDDDVLEAFYAANHVLICPPAIKDNHALQFLSTGAPVIASRTGGAQQWLSSAIGYPVDGDLVSEDSISQLKDRMLYAVRNRDQCKRQGETAAILLPDMLGWDKVLTRLFTILAEMVPGDGERLFHKAKVAQEQIRERNRR